MKNVFVLICLFSLTLHAQTHRVYVGSFDLAGLVPSDLPAEGESLKLPSMEQPLTDPSGRSLGYIPIRFRPSLENILATDLPLHIEVQHVYHEPRPGKALRITLWIETVSPEALPSLTYSIPIHSDVELADLY